MPTTDAHHGCDDPPSVSRSPDSDENTQPFPPLIIEHEQPPNPEYMQENVPPYSKRLVDDVEEGGEDRYDNEEKYKDRKQNKRVEEDAEFPSHYSLRASSPSSESSSSEDEPSTHEPSVQLNSSFLGPNAFTPPFYNRPPTPLPPSPSLTSLLRPAFSTTTTSRPTTPESSDVDTPNDTEAAVAQSARNATTVPRVSPKVPTYEYYGFVLYLTSSLTFLIYLLWSYLPSPFLHQLGIYYYPNRWWSLAIPAYLVMTLIYIYVALAAYNTGHLTLPMNSIENIVDDAGNVAVIDSKGRRRAGGSAKMNPDATTAQTMGSQKRKLPWREIWSEGTDGVMDIPIGGVCEVLYGDDDMDEACGVQR